MNVHTIFSLFVLLSAACGPDVQPGDPLLVEDADPGDVGADSSESPDMGSNVVPDTTTPDVDAVGIISGISLFQVIDVPVLDESGTVIAAAARSAPIVAGRAIRAVVYLQQPQGWTPGEVSVEFEIGAGAASDTVSGAFLLDADSVVGDPATGVQLDIPAELVQPDASFSVSVSVAGDANTLARVPATGVTSLGVVETGPIKIHLVPYETNGLTPATTPDVVDGFRDAVLAVYPTAQVDITVGATRSFHTNNLGELLVDVGVAQESDGAAVDVYYYGMVSGVDERDDFLGSTGTSENGGESPQRAYFAAGAAFGDELSESTFVHELGHMHQLEHAPCGDPPNVDDMFPNTTGETGVLGFDFRTGEFVPADANDLMGYCQPRWIGVYHYQRLLEHVQTSQTW